MRAGRGRNCSGGRARNASKLDRKTFPHSFSRNRRIHLSGKKRLRGGRGRGRASGFYAGACGRFDLGHSRQNSQNLGARCSFGFRRRQPDMILPAVSELLSRVTRESAVETVFARLRESSPREAALTGLTDPAKAILAAHAAVAMRRPIIFLTASNQRAETLLEPLRYFCRAFGG